MDYELYHWRQFFGGVAKELCEYAENPDRDNAIRDWVKEIFLPDHRMLNYSSIDPFSIIYTLATKGPNTIAVRDRLVEKYEYLEVPNDIIFPTPVGVNTFFHSGANRLKGDETLEANKKALDGQWQLFVRACNAQHSSDISDGEFRYALENWLGFGLANFTQVLFLVNPEVFLPIDDGTTLLLLDKLGVNEHKDTRRAIEKEMTTFSTIMETVLSYFPSCKPYEINWFLYHLNVNDPEKKLKLSKKFWLISSYAYGDGDDYWSDDKDGIAFRPNSYVWTGGKAPQNDEKKGLYPAKYVKKGDIMLVHAGEKMHGIGVVIENGYRDGWTEDDAIYVVWIAVDDTGKVPEHTIGLKKALMNGESFTGRYEKAFHKTWKILDILESIQVMEKDANKNIILTGPPGTGKTRLAKLLAKHLCERTGEEIVLDMVEGLRNGSATSSNSNWEDDVEELISEGRIDVLQFHPAWNYEDFVRGIVAKTNDAGHITYIVEDKHLATMAARAQEDSARAYVLIIDEINRANLPAVLGELIYALEYRGKAVQTVYPDPQIADGDNHTLSIPTNLYIIGTMNTADRSTGAIDYAIRRRFIFVGIPSNSEVVPESAKALYGAVEELFAEEYLSSEFKKEDMMIGHSYFLPRGGAGNADISKEELEQRLNYEIRPLLQEYLRDGIFSAGAEEKIHGLTCNGSAANA